MQSLDEKILARIRGRGHGWAFTKSDFMADMNEAGIHKALSTLAKTGKVRRVCHGVYDSPKESEFLGKTLGPDMDQVAHALARKFGWRILPTGETALNLLGLSTQVPGRWAYLSDGPSRSYEVDGQELVFTKTALKDASLKHRESRLVVQAIKSLGREGMTPEALKQLGRQLDKKAWERVLKDTRSIAGWIHRFIKLASRESNR